MKFPQRWYEGGGWMAWSPDLTPMDKQNATVNGFVTWNVRQRTQESSGIKLQMF